MAVNNRQFWDPVKGQEITAHIQTHEDILHEMYKTLKALHERVEALETAYMEDKLLGKAGDPGTIESCLTQNKS